MNKNAARELAEGVWPTPLSHCGEPLVGAGDNEIVIGEISSESINGFAGNRMLYTALVPEQDIESVLTSVGGIGHGVSTNTRQNTFDSNGICHSHFWIDAADGKKFESLIHSWVNHNKIVLMPDSALLLCYGLTPQVMKDGIYWDDLDKPTYGVIRVTPLADYDVHTGYTTARITIQRDYLEDYLDLKRCVAVATYFDERYSKDDPQVAALMDGGGSHFRQPGRELWFMPMEVEFANQIAQVWTCAPLLKSTGSLISNPLSTSMRWPDRPSPIDGNGRQAAFAPGERAYVRDEVLEQYENRDEFQVFPEAGSVSYGSRWSVGYTGRFSRNIIELELRKLYEGAPLGVIQHFNRFAVKEELAEHDRVTHGTRNIGSRAKELVESYLALTETLAGLSGTAGLSLKQEDIGQFSSSDVKYHGWSSFPNLRVLGNVAPLELTFPEFLGRCKNVFRLLENVRPSALRQLLRRLGLSEASMGDFGGMKLLASVAQLATIAREEGISLIRDSAAVSSKWNSGRLVDEFKVPFALNVLRICDAHNRSKSDGKVSESLAMFGIDEKKCRSGWGEALDKVYDQTLVSIGKIDKLIQSGQSR